MNSWIISEHRHKEGICASQFKTKHSYAQSEHSEKTGTVYRRLKKHLKDSFKQQIQGTKEALMF